MLQLQREGRGGAARRTTSSRRAEGVPGWGGDAPRSRKPQPPSQQQQQRNAAHYVSVHEVLDLFEVPDGGAGELPECVKFFEEQLAEYQAEMAPPVVQAPPLDAATFLAVLVVGRFPTLLPF